MASTPFLSTPSVGRATHRGRAQGLPREISIHALRGEGDPQRAAPPAGGGISIHALRGEGDSVSGRSSVALSIFLSTPSVGRATWRGCRPRAAMRISIHALRGEGDGHRQPAESPQGHFYPRPPWGGRRFPQKPARSGKDFYPRPPWGGRRCCRLWTLPTVIGFLSTPSVGRATDYPIHKLDTGLLISIHALRGEGDQGAQNRPGQYPDFYPRPPWGGRP